MKPRTHASQSIPQLPADSLAFALLRTAEVIAKVIGGRNLDVALAACWQAHAPLPAQRGAIQDLAYGSLRQYGRGDFLLTQLLREPLDETGDKPLLRGLLLATLYRLETRPADTHTTVDQAVNAAAAIGRGQFKALTNAVLRNRLRRSTELLTAADADPVAHWQHPGWWIEKLRTAYPQQWQEILAAGNSHPPMTLRVNRRRSTVEDYLARLTAAGIAARALDDSAILLDKPQGVDKLPDFFSGLASVQDWGAQRAAGLLDAHAGMRILDACAAPGGKTAHLLENLEVELLALDAEAQRVERIRDNLQRLDLQATLKTADCRTLDDWWDGRPFDRILVDAPCSASGVVRRHPDSKWLRRPEDIYRFARTQRQILAALWRVLAPGGKMLYCTCSVFPEENQQQIDAFLRQHADAEQLPMLTAPVATRLALQLTPTNEHDGFFYAILQKRS